MTSGQSDKGGRGMVGAASGRFGDRCEFFIGRRYREGKLRCHQAFQPAIGSSLAVVV